MQFIIYFCYGCLCEFCEMSPGLGSLSVHFDDKWGFFSGLTVFLVNLFLIKKKKRKKKGVIVHMPSGMEWRVICLCTCQGYST